MSAWYILSALGFYPVNPYLKFEIRHKDFLQGGTLEFLMSSQPEKSVNTPGLSSEIKE